jgi:hypothetical protein
MRRCVKTYGGGNLITRTDSPHPQAHHAPWPSTAQHSTAQHSTEQSRAEQSRAEQRRRAVALGLIKTQSNYTRSLGSKITRSVPSSQSECQHSKHTLYGQQPPTVGLQVYRFTGLQVE